MVLLCCVILIKESLQPQGSYVGVIAFYIMYYASEVELSIYKWVHKTVMILY